jgi:hypothetical protein
MKAFVVWYREEERGRRIGIQGNEKNKGENQSVIVSLESYCDSTRHCSREYLVKRLD